MGNGWLSEGAGQMWDGLGRRSGGWVLVLGIHGSGGPRPRHMWASIGKCEGIRDSGSQCGCVSVTSLIII